MQVSLTDWRSLRRNSLLGFASIRVGALLIKDVTLHSNKVESVGPAFLQAAH